jgi:hypothetical protein
MTIASNTLRTDGDTASLPVADAAAARSVAREDGRAEAAEGVPFSNTGQKIKADIPAEIC